MSGIFLGKGLVGVEREFFRDIGPALAESRRRGGADRLLQFRRQERQAFRCVDLEGETEWLEPARASLRSRILRREVRRQ